MAKTGGWSDPRMRSIEGRYAVAAEADRPRRTKVPSLKAIEHAVETRGGCPATDGCWVEPDGTCPHGAKSWLLEWGMI